MGERFKYLKIYCNLMRITKKVIRVGRSSIGIVIDKAIAERMGIRVGDIVEVELRKVE